MNLISSFFLFSQERYNLSNVFTGTQPGDGARGAGERSGGGSPQNRQGQARLRPRCQEVVKFS